MKVDWMFFDVGFDRDKIFVDKRRGRIVRIGFGLQPNASASGRSRAEVDQQRFVARFRLGERCIDVFVPFDSHLPFLRYNNLIFKLPNT
jgi:hypothetical protein